MQRNQMAGGGLTVGYLILLLFLFRDPASGVEAASSGLSALLYFLALPLAGVAVGVYTYADGTYSLVPVFVLASYLGVFGVGLVLGSLLGADPLGLTFVVGLMLLPLAVVALVGSLLASTTAIGSDLLGFSSA